MKYTIFSLARQLASVHRYSRDFSHHRESVLEHMGFCAIYSYATALELAKLGVKVDIGLLLKKAILHDVEEAETGDISRPAKYFSSETSSSLKKFEEVAANTICSDVFDAASFFLWQNAKDDTTEGRIVALSDFASVVYQLQNELKTLGNRSFIRVQEELRAFLPQKIRAELAHKERTILGNFLLLEYEKLLSLVNEASL